MEKDIIREIFAEYYYRLEHDKAYADNFCNKMLQYRKVSSFHETVKKAIFLLSKMNFKRNVEDRITLLFESDKFIDVINGLAKSFRCIVWNVQKKNIIRLLLDGSEVTWKNNNLWHNRLGEAFKNRNDFLLRNIIDSIKFFLLKSKVDIIILPNDREPMQRALIFAAREMGIPSIVYLHGKLMVCKETCGTYADYFWTWGLYDRDNFIKMRLKDALHVKCMGYPYAIKMVKGKEYNRIVYLGQPYEYGKRKKIKDAYVRNIYQVALRIGYEMVYRLHPAEDIRYVKKEYSDLKKMKYSNAKAINKEFSECSIVIGINSTMLLEAYLYEKKAIQLIDELFGGEEFITYGITRGVKNNQDSIFKAVTEQDHFRSNIAENYYIKVNRDIITCIQTELMDIVSAK